MITKIEIEYQHLIGLGEQRSQAIDFTAFIEEGFKRNNATMEIKLTPAEITDLMMLCGKIESRITFEIRDA